MNRSNKTGLTVAFLGVVILFLVFGFGTMSRTFMGGGMMADGTIGQAGFGGNGGWMWFPMLITLGIGLWLGWMLFAKKT